MMHLKTLGYLATCLMIACVTGQEGQTLRGVVELDTITFDKIVDGSKNVVVRLDDKYNYGEQSEQWQYFSFEMSEVSNLLLAQCTISEYEETMENFEIFDRYDVSLDFLPKFLLFKAGEDVSKPIIYPRSNSEGYLVTSDEMKQLLIDENIWLGLEGTIEEFNQLVLDFTSLYQEKKSQEMTKLRAMTIEEIRDDIGNKGKEIVRSFESNSDPNNEFKLKSAKYYMKVMAKMMKEGKSYAQTEMERIEKLLYDENVKQSLKKWFQIRMNILSEFGAKPQIVRENPYQQQSGYGDYGDYGDYDDGAYGGYGDGYDPYYDDYADHLDF